MLQFLCPGLVPVIEMVGRVSEWFGIVALRPAISVTSVVNRGVVSLESVRVGLAHYFVCAWILLY